MKRNYFIVLFIFLIFFVISFLTNILGPIIPDIIRSFRLSLTLAAFLPFAFFIAYGVMSIPAGWLVEKYSEKSVMIGAFGLAFSGAFLFSSKPNFQMALFSLFLIGIGMAMLQVAINPLLRTAGGEQHFAFNSVLAQLIFGSASFISPHVYSYLVIHLKNPEVNSPSIFLDWSRFIPDNMEWISLYWIFSAITLLMFMVLFFVPLPKVQLKDDERIGFLKTHLELLRKPIVILYFIGIFAYVGSEQGVANWISQFLSDTHGLDPQTIGAKTVSNFWGALTIGCLVGLILLKLFDGNYILIGFSGASMVCLGFALFGPTHVAIFMFPAVGFFFSVMWSVIFSLALNSIARHHGTFSGILCTGIIGGAVIPLVIGWLADQLGLRYGLLFLFFTLGYIFSVGFWAKPLIRNKIIKI